MTSQEQEHQEIARFMNKYNITQKEQDCMVISSHQHSYLSKSIQLDSTNTQVDKVLQTLEQHQTLNQNYILTLLNYNIQEVPNSTMFIIKTLYQYAPLSLKQEIQNRKNHQSRFQEEEIWAIIYSITKSLQYLEKLNIGYGVLGCDKIFIDKRFKLIDPSAIAEDPLTLSPFRLYSPETICQYDHIDILKSDVFVLGLCIIEAVLLISLSNEDLPKYDETRIKIYVQQVGDIYGDGMADLLRQMLQYSPQDRPTFSQIRQYLEDNLELVDQSDSYFSPLPPDTEDQPNTQELCEQTEELQINDVEEEGQSSSFTASLNEFQKAKLRFLDESRVCTIKELSQIEEDSHLSSSILPELNSHFSMEKRKTSKSIKEKVVKNTNNLQLQVVQVKNNRKQRQPPLQNMNQNIPNNLFTNPKLLKQIQNELRAIASSRNNYHLKQNYQRSNY